ncbi:MAG: winged helix-turn-helix domain-containing protein [Rubrobacteraceae bacterium]
MDFKAAAREVLGEIGHPLHYSDITEIALEDGYLNSAGQTPQNTMRARLSVDVRDNPKTPFAQTAPGVYGLKEWSLPLPEE